MGLVGQAVKPRRGYLAQDAAKLTQVKEIFKERLALALRAKGLDAEPRPLAALIGTGDREARRYLDGDRLPGAIILGRIERALAVTVGWLVGLDSPETALDLPQERRAGMTGVAVAEGDEMTRHAQAQLVSEAFGRVVGKHEVVGTDLRKVLMRMAAGLDALNHHEAAGEIYGLLVELNKMDLGKEKP
jgi:hypothetical protein